MATWAFYGFEIGATDTSDTGAWRITINTAVGLANSTTWPTNRKISVGSFNNYMHVLKSTASANIATADACPRPGRSKHMQCVSRGSTSGQYNYIWNDATKTGTLSTNRTLTQSSPAPKECLELHFNHGNAVALDPIQIWSGSGDAVTDYLRAASVYFVEQGTASPTWTESTPSSKKTLTSRYALKTDHRIYFGLCAKINDVSFNNNGRIKISATYS